MNLEYMEKAQEKIENTPDHPEQDNHDIALKEICEGLLTVEMTFSQKQENTTTPSLDYDTSIIL